MKPAIALTIGFAIAAIGSTGAKVAMHKPAPDTSIADSTKADSTAHDDSEPADHSGDAPSGTAPAASADPGAPQPPDSTHGTAHPDTGTAAARPKVAAATPVTPQSDSAALAPVRRLGKLFESMPPKEAAQVLSHMSDADARIILDAMKDTKKAGAVLAAIEPARAAVLSKPVIPRLQ